MVTCDRCDAQAAFTGHDGERLCERHYHSVLSVAPTIVSTSTIADALGAKAVAAGVGRRMEHDSWWRRIRRRVRP
jgi:hypothetical protein